MTPTDSESGERRGIFLRIIRPPIVSAASNLVLQSGLYPIRPVHAFNFLPCRMELFGLFSPDLPDKERDGSRPGPPAVGKT
jgi:hypothetical protein